MSIFKKTVSVFIALAGLFQTAHAEIEFKEIKKNDVIRVVNTGQGYFKGSIESNKYAFYSKDKVNWIEVDNYLGKQNMFFNNVPYLGVLETDDKFITYTQSIGMPAEVMSTFRSSDVTVLDKEFNIIKELNSDVISRLSYINGVYYANKYLKFSAEKPGPSIVTNAVLKQASYYSTDLENWQLYKEDGGIPIIHNGRELFINNNNIKLHGAGETFIALPDKEATVAFSENGEVKQKIIYENLRFTDLIQANGYLFAIPCRESQYVVHMTDYFAVSKDGVYFTVVHIPEYDDPYGFDVQAVYELENGDMEIDIGTEFKTTRYEFTVEDLENTIRQGDIYVQFRDKILGFETPPVMEDDRVLVPMRFLFEQMGAEVTWDDATQTATAVLNNKSVTFSIDDTEAEVNNSAVTMDVPARLINDKTMVPLRFLSEELGYTVTWDDAANTAIIE